MNIAKILANCPNGRHLWSSAFGPLFFQRVNVDNKEPYIVCATITGYITRYDEEGRYLYDLTKNKAEESERCSLFPSMSQNWADLTRLVKLGDNVIFKDGTLGTVTAKTDLLAVAGFSTEEEVEEYRRQVVETARCKAQAHQSERLGLDVYGTAVIDYNKFTGSVVIDVRQVHLRYDTRLAKKIAGGQGWERDRDTLEIMGVWPSNCAYTLEAVFGKYSTASGLRVVGIIKGKL